MVTAEGRQTPASETRVLDGSVYLRSAAVLSRAERHAGKRWLRVPLRGPRLFSSPTSLIEESRGAENLGTEVIHGRALVHYRLRQYSGGTASGPASEIWVDSHDRVRRAKCTTLANGVTVTQLIDFFDFGATIPLITAPPTSKVITRATGTRKSWPGLRHVTN
jgi:hypothetical protein